MGIYNNEYGSVFPNESSIALHNFEDITDSVVASSEFQEVNELRVSGNDTEAQKRIIQYNLQKYIVDALVFNLWEEEINNTQVYARQMQQRIYFGKNEPDCCIGDTWIAGGE